ncbi:MAG TPA: asparaginase [Gaiellaceae bacterium]|nr:asparaginase [Gaiellaceae bacterium]
MAETITVAVRRGETVESRHRVHAVAVQDGTVVAEAGEGGLVTFMRSSAKPLQALPLTRALPELTEEELAIACASHAARPEQLAAVRSLLARASAGEDELECGEEGHPPARIKHNCSGKHAGMLALCRAHGWDSRGYRLPDHPCQRAMRAEVAAAADLDPDELGTGIDGCGVIAFALPLERMALAFGRLERLDGGDRVASAMRAHPALIRGPGAPDTTVMRAHEGWIAKGGAEGAMCAAGPRGLGVALKVESGESRAVGPATAAFLARLGFPVERLESAPVENSRGELVGEIRAE